MPKYCTMLCWNTHFVVIFPTAKEGLLGLVKPHLPSAQQLPEFFWRHLERDLQILGQATGKSVDEAAIIMHLVLRGILTVDPPRCRSSCVVSPYLVCITVLSLFCMQLVLWVWSILWGPEMQDKNERKYSTKFTSNQFLRYSYFHPVTNQNDSAWKGSTSWSGLGIIVCDRHSAL